MAVVGLRNLSRNTRGVVEELEKTGEPVIVTRHGRPIAAIVAVDQQRLENLALAATPEFAQSTDRADEALDMGETRSLSEALAETDETESSLAPSASAFRKALQQFLAVHSSLGSAEVPASHAGVSFYEIDTHEQFVVRADLPGFAESDVAVTLEDNVLTVSANREETSEGSYAFSRSVHLPEGLDRDAAMATLEDGVLEVRFRKPGAAKRSSVHILAGGVRSSGLAAPGPQDTQARTSSA